jgi:hypothetical protein
MSVSHEHEHPLEGALPQSAGIPFSVRLLVGGSLLLVLMQGLFTLAASDFGRIWPSSDSTKVQLKK